jgi:hypothetical protein
MDYRHGKCSDCGAEYKIPTSFVHNVARCKVCKGVVRLGPAASAETRAPARAAASVVPAEHVRPEPQVAVASSGASIPAARNVPAGAPGVRTSTTVRAPGSTQPPTSLSREAAHARAPRRRFSWVAALVLVIGSVCAFLFRGSLFGSDPLPASSPASGTGAAAPGAPYDAEPRDPGAPSADAEESATAPGS